jgi:hypothetical protein
MIDSADGRWWITVLGKTPARDAGRATPTRTRLCVIAILIGPNGAEKSTIVE